MAKKPDKPEEIPYTEYEEVETWKETWKEPQKEVVDRVSEKPRQDSLAVLNFEVPAVSNLTEEDIVRKDEFKSTIDLSNSKSLVEFWAEPSTEIANVAGSLLADTKTRELDHIWKELTALITTLETWDFYWKDKWLVSKLKRWIKRKRNWMLTVEDIIWKIEGIVDLGSAVSGYRTHQNERKLHLIGFRVPARWSFFSIWGT